MAMTLQQLTSQINSSATRWHVSPWILLGVFGKETAFGSDVHTSTAGAVGLTQFLPSTAAKYNYPLTNNPTSAQAQQQFNATAHYLSDLYHQTGSWDSALRHYSGGGYGLADVQAEAKQALGTSGAANFFGGLHPGGPELGLPAVPVPSIPNPLSGVEAIAAFLTNPTNWLRIGEVIAGLILVMMGLRSLTGFSIPTPATAGRRVATSAGLGEIIR